MLKRSVTFKGNPLTLVGRELKAGDKAPDFVCFRFLPDKGLVKVTLADALGGKPTMFSVVPSLDTPVCSTQTHKFNSALAGLAGKVNCYTVSVDLPFAQNRFCNTCNITNSIPLSDYQERSFGQNYGVLIDELKLLARSVFVVDKDGTIRYCQIVPEVTQEPDYDSALAALRSLVA
ncbi:MAG: thiol peroxidase [Gemmatales bacterium]|nr:thiol peroxidase [Gemmatales bacterium]MDW8176379.1 thiol peroxidase [Gemmatales bacterium]